MEEVSFDLTGIAWNVGRQLWPDWNILEWRKLPGMAWNGRSQFWPDWNRLEWRKLVLA
jgi:hypothetical protein